MRFATDLYEVLLNHALQVVFVPDKSKKWQMVYRGRIDDRYVAFGKMRPAPTVRDLEQVLEAIIAGKEVKTKVTKAVGCFISS